MIDRLKEYKKPKYETLNIIEIKRKTLISNLRVLKEQRPQSEIIPVLKANAYGHGLKEVCQILKGEVKTVAVDSFPEAQIAYKYFKGQVLIMGEMPNSAYKYCNFKKTEFCLYNRETLRYLANKFGKKIKVHLFINTGMNREGIKDLNKFINDNAHYLKKIKVLGLASHLSSAETTSLFNKKQEDKFQEAVQVMKNNGYKDLKTHLGNSAGVFTLKGEYSAYRAGIGFYGYNILNDKHEKYQEASKLKPALKVLSKIISLQNIKTDEIVSYNENFKAQDNVSIATIPFGYYEGLSRLLSNKAKLKVITEKETFYAPISGNVCMNLTCLDIGKKIARVGDKVEIISSHEDNPNSLSELSKISQTIIYEPLVKLAGNIRRIIV